MKLRRNITVFVRKPDGHSISWERYVIKKAFVSQTLEANSNISAKGFVPNSRVLIRFPVKNSLKLTPGDFIYLGNTDLSSPPSGSFSVLSITGGERGSRTLRLIKVVCG